jgi:hypothetical protein
MRRYNRKARSVAGWQSGHAADCKSVYAGSIPTPASNHLPLVLFSAFSRHHGAPGSTDRRPCGIRCWVAHPDLSLSPRTLWPGAQDGTRTRTPFKAPNFKSGTSTDSVTRAHGQHVIPVAKRA